MLSPSSLAHTARSWTDVDYDVIVIGAGPSGLTCANMVAMVRPCLRKTETLPTRHAHGETICHSRAAACPRAHRTAGPASLQTSVSASARRRVAAAAVPIQWLYTCPPGEEASAALMPPQCACHASRALLLIFSFRRAPHRGSEPPTLSSVPIFRTLFPPAARTGLQMHGDPSADSRGESSDTLLALPHTSRPPRTPSACSA